MRVYVIMTLLVMSLALSLYTHSELPEWSLYTGSFYTSGTYGGDALLEELYFPISIAYTGTRFGYRMTIPYLMVDAPVIVFDEADLALENPSYLTTRLEGAGDITASFTAYDLKKNYRYNFAIDISGKIKIATTEYNPYLSSGENDYEIQCDFYKFLKRSTLFYSAGYRIRGDPEGLELDNVWLHTIGFSYKISPNFKTGLIYSFRQSSLEYFDPIEEISTFISFNLNKHWQLQLHGISGISESALDWGAGILIKKTFN